MNNLPKGRWATRNEWLTKCHSCGKEKFYWNVQKKEGICQRCKVTLHGVKQFEEAYEVGQYFLELETSSEAETVPLEAKPAMEVSIAKAYLKTRFVEEDFGFLSDGYYIYSKIDSLSPEYPDAWVKREINGKGWFVLRGVEKKNYAYRWNEMLQDTRIPCFVEGVFDAIPKRFEGVNEVAILGSYISPVLVAAIEELNPPIVVTAFDPDAAGRDATKSIARELRVLGIVHYPLELKIEAGDIDPKAEILREYNYDLRSVLFSCRGSR